MSEPLTNINLLRAYAVTDLSIVRLDVQREPATEEEGRIFRALEALRQLDIETRCRAAAIMDSHGLPGWVGTLEMVAC